LILLTTSRRPTERIRTFCRDLFNSLPDVVRINRGKLSRDGVAEKAIELDADRIVVVDRWHCGPGKVSLFSLSSNGLNHIPPLMLMSRIHLRRELKESTKRIRSSVITIEPEASPELDRVARHLSQFFNLPILSKDVASKNNRVSMHFSCESSRRLQITFLLLQRMVEIGPRLTLSQLVWDVSS